MGLSRSDEYLISFYVSEILAEQISHLLCDFSLREGRGILFTVVDFYQPGDTSWEAEIKTETNLFIALASIHNWL